MRNRQYCKVFLLNENIFVIDSLYLHLKSFNFSPHFPYLQIHIHIPSFLFSKEPILETTIV